MPLKKRYLASTIAWVTTALLSPQVALSSEGFELEEIIVTATKRAESVQDIAAAVTALNANVLAERGIVNIESLAASVPGMHFSQAGADTRITVRGIGAEQNTVTGDPGVAFHIDGVYQARASAGAALFYDLERVEVLRGPQGTLYGRNATGGSINVISKAPADEFGGKFELQVGEFNQQVFKGVLNAPLIADKLLARVSVRQETRDGYYQNTAAGSSDLDDVDSVNLRTQLLFMPNENVDVLLAMNYATQKGAGNGARVDGAYPVSFFPINQITSNLGGTGLVPYVYPQASSVPSANPSGDWQISTNGEHNRDNERKGASVTVNWDLGSIAFKSISAWQDNVVDEVRDVDFTDAEIMNEYRLQDSRQYSQELQLSSTDEGPLQWLAGAYWLKEETSANYWLFDDGSGLSALVYNNPFLPLQPGVPSFFIGMPYFGTVDSGQGFDAVFGNESVINSESLGAFAQASYELNSDLTATAGVRWSEDKKDADIRFKRFGNNFLVPESEFSKSDSWDALTWKLGLDWFVTEDSMVYATVSTGFKSGGFLQDPQSDSYDEEHIQSWELGSKNRFLDGKMQANVSAYYYDYEDMQLSTVLNNQLVTTNAGEADVLGLEVELLARPIDALELSVALAHTRAKFVDYQADNPLVPGVTVEVLDNNEMARSPDWTMNVAAAYTIDLAYGSLTASANMFWTDEVYFSAFNRLNDPSDYQGGYHVTDLRLHFASNDDVWFVSLAAKNLEDELVASNASPRSDLGGPDATIQWQAPKTWSLSAGYNF